MNGVHDIGGMHGFGRLVPDDGTLFHARWEARVLALQRAMSFTRFWHIDDFRYAMERIPAKDYLSISYYERWLLGLERNVVEHGVVDADELEVGHALRGGPAPAQTLAVRDVPLACARGSFGRNPVCPAKFVPGERVRTRNLNPQGHTRLPRYARHRVGTVERVHGCHVYPDTVVNQGSEDPQWLYTVVFAGRDLWGDDADSQLKVSIEAFEPYLEKA